MTAEPRPSRARGGRVMALDVGDRRIGVAVSDETATIATPLRYVPRNTRDLDELRRLVADWQIREVVVGLPRGLSGREGPQAEAVRAYADRLAATLTVPVTFWDERLTTAIAEKRMIEAGVRRITRRERIDAAAAAVILQSYLDAMHHRSARD